MNTTSSLLEATVQYCFTCVKPFSGDLSTNLIVLHPTPQRVYRNVRLWMMLVDLEESLGSLDTCRASYDRILELRIATPQIVLNYALMLQEHKFFEDAFQVGKLANLPGGVRLV